MQGHSAPSHADERPQHEDRNSGGNIMTDINPKQFSRRRFFACAILLLALGASVAFAFNPRASADSIRANLSQEVRVLIVFGNELFAHDLRVEQLSKKATLTRVEVESVNTKAADLKRQLPRIQQAFRSLMDKLKAVRQFDNFNAIVLTRARNATERTLMEEDGGPRRQLERLATDIPNLAKELDDEVQGLRSKLRAQAEENILNPKTLRRAVRVAFTPAAPVFFFRPLRCAYWKAVWFTSEPGSAEESEAFDKGKKFCSAGSSN